jgi:hypothetical protein
MVTVLGAVGGRLRHILVAFGTNRPMALDLEEEPEQF